MGVLRTIAVTPALCRKIEKLLRYLSMCTPKVFTRPCSVLESLDLKTGSMFSRCFYQVR